MSNLCEFGSIYTLGWHGELPLIKAYRVNAGPLNDRGIPYYLIDEMATACGTLEITVEAVQVMGYRNLEHSKPAIGSIFSHTDSGIIRRFFYPTPHICPR